ncbi:MAG: hypothetical protein IKL04_05585 [Lachnospiraceae bacterium]|nr:hypothetical protein [Lachnospiraceae bacterium]
MIFKCKNCGGNTVYSPEKKQMHCPYCDGAETQDRFDFPEFEGNYTICPNCRGEISTDVHTASSRCPYCDTYLIFNERVEGEYLPAYVLPFQIGKDKCKEMLKEQFKKKTFAPTDFLSEARLETIEGDYVPFWLFDYDSVTDFTAEGRKVRRWTSGNYQYTETSYYEIRRNMSAGFRKVPADASTPMPDEVMDLMEPYDYTQLQKFEPQFLSGFMSEKFNLPAIKYVDRVKVKMQESIDAYLKGTYTGYSSVSPLSKTTQYNNEQTHYALLPVWVYHYEYAGKKYPFYVNGQTGKIVGKVPVSLPKVLAYGGTLWGALALILVLLSFTFRFM